jgi:hypothetical protein
MIRLFVFHNKIVSSWVILFLFFYLWSKDINAFAQTNEKEPGNDG